jgi:hypothetical protein
MEPGLLQPEQFEMIDEEGAQEHDPPTAEKQCPEDGPGERVGNVPHQPPIGRQKLNRMISAALANIT